MALFSDGFTYVHNLWECILCKTSVFTVTREKLKVE